MRLFREDAPAAFSPIAAGVAKLSLRAHCSIAHIRKATQGVVALENCHPFRRATLADDDLSVDFAQLTAPDDVVTILSTEPLTRDECWQQLPPGEAVLLQHGEVQLRRQGAEMVNIDRVPVSTSCSAS